ncbi:MAG: ABC transporter substrate-binding protein [Planctomycetes bacterium]|nr:ABC transporter substrate-binding protein [Planctomycetota bacterium]
MTRFVRVLLALTIWLTVAAAPAVSGETVYGLPRSETMVLGMIGDVQTINPFLANMRFNTSIDYHTIHDTLVHRAADGTITPRMAESWRRVDDLTWEFKLRPGIVSHRGEKLTSENVKFTFDMVQSKPEYAVYQFPQQVMLDRIDIVDDLTFRVVTKEPSSTVLYWLFESPIVPIGFYKGASEDKMAGESDGFGPYKFSKYVPNDYMILEAFENHWNGAPPIKNLVFRVIPEESARINELRAGSIDFAEQISVDIAPQAETAISHVDAKPGLRKMALTISIEKGHPALKDKRVRQAMNYAVDKENITENILSDFTAPYSSYVNPANNNPDLKPYPYDPEKAKALLAEAGYPDGFKLTIVPPSSRYGLDKEITQQLAADLADVGIDTDVRYLELGVFLERNDAKELTDLVWIGWAALTNPIIENLILTTGHVDNNSTWSNAEFDSLFKRLNETKDPEEALRINFAMQKLAWEECPWIWLWKLPQVNGINNRIQWNTRNDGYIDAFNASFK